MRFLKKATLLLAATLLFCVSIQAQSSLKRANKQYELKAFNLAIKSYQKVLDKQENNVAALTGIADSYRHLNQMTQAAEFYERAVQQRKVDNEAFLNYGKTLKAIGQYDEAKKWFNRYAQKYPADGRQYAASCDFAKEHRNDAALFEVSNEYINSSGSDFGAAMFGTAVVYSSSRNDITKVGSNRNNWDNGAGNRLYFTTPDNTGFLKPPSYVHDDITNNFNQGPVAYSPDGRLVAITKNNFVEGTRQIPSSGVELNLYLAGVTSGGNWKGSKAFAFNGAGYSTGYPSFSPDGNSLYFASDRPDGFGGFDIYVCRRTGNTWSTPENMGAVINSAGNEISPFFDGTSLYFSSDWHQGMGGYDIFRAEKTGSQWASIYHTGTALNSSRDDYDFVYNRMSNRGYFTSNRVNGKGLEDIYRVTKLTDAVVLQITDEATGMGISGASVDFSSCGEGVYATDNNGIYSFQMMNGLNCSPVIKKEGYMSTSFSLSTATLQNNKRVIINMRKIGAGYNGRVMNINTRVALSNVTIRATNQNDNSTITSISDGSGEYVLQLAPNTPYLIRYSKEGYIDASRTLRTSSSGTDLSILGSTSITPTSGGYADGGNNGGAYNGGNNGGYNGGNSGTNSGGGYTGGNSSGNNGNSGTYTGGNSSTGGYTGTNSGTSGGTIRSGYSVQIAAVSANKTLDLNAFQNRLSDLGSIYYTPAGNINKIRLGTYTTRAEALRAQQQVLGRGYSGAFIVTENGGGNSGNYNSGNTSGGGQTTINSNSPYVVRLAAYSNPEKYFDANKVIDIGRLNKQYSGQYTIMILSGYDSYDSALRALRKAKTRGFKDAYIAQNINGVLKKVK